MPTKKKFEIEFETLEDLDKAILNYLENCKKDQRPLTISGLANALDTNRQTLLNYEKKKGYEKYFYTIKKAKSLCEQYAEEMLFKGKNVAGVIFNLKNNYKDWKDTSRFEHTGADGDSIPIDVTVKSAIDKVYGEK